jgi:hypothetical protein
MSVRRSPYAGQTSLPVRAPARPVRGIPALADAASRAVGVGNPAEPWAVSLAREVALLAHGNQRDKLGRPYGEHLLGVYRGVVVLGGSVEAEQAAFLHDVVEDTPVTVKDLTEVYGFSPAVASTVEAVTKRQGEVQEEYLERVIAAGADAIAVKTADLLHNTRPDRLAGLPEYTRARLLRKYRPSLAALLLAAERIVDMDGQAAALATTPTGSARRWEAPVWAKGQDPLWGKPSGSKPQGV